MDYKLEVLYDYESQLADVDCLLDIKELLEKLTTEDSPIRKYRFVQCMGGIFVMLRGPYLRRKKQCQKITVHKRPL